MMDTRSPTCGYPHCADYDERCALGINVPCGSVNPEGPAAQACRSDIEAGRRSGLFIGFLLGAMFVVGVLAAFKVISLFI